MISRLPNWIEYGAFVLALVAGYINAIGLLSFEHQSVSHLSGITTQLGVSAVDGALDSIGHLGGVVLSFVLGSALSGYLVHGDTLKLGRHYDTALAIESVFIFASFYLLSNGSFYGHFTASLACGMQNALATTYSGAIVRTTHLTGIFTDLGIMFGSIMRGKTFDKRKAILFSLIITGFLVGGALGAYLFGVMKFQALIFPGIVSLSLAGLYRFHFRRKTSTS